MRVLLAIVLVTGCAFEHGELPGDDGSGETGSGSGTGSDNTGDTSTLRVCRFPDAALRLCVEFDDRVYNPVVHDASAAQMDALADNVNEWQRGGSYAAQVNYGSDLRIPETPNLDIAGPLSIEMWVAAGFDQDAYLLRNDGQYVVTVDDDGHITCQLAGVAATSQTSIRNGSWAHVGCTYDQSQVKVWINGKVQGCRGTNVAVSTTGTSGTRLAPAWIGAIDDIRINARALSLAEMCVRAGAPAGCSDDCPTGGSGGPGPGGGD